MPSPNLSDLVTTTTPSQALALELTDATALGLSVTSWQPIDPTRTIFQMFANIQSQYSSTVALIAQGGYLSYAAQMVDVNGTPITTWMDLVGQNQYNVTRIPASLAAGPVPVTNATATVYPYSPNSPLHFQNPTTGATYTSTGTGSILGSTSSVVQVQADQAYIGNAGTSAVGVTLTLVTPLAGVTVNALTTGLVGNDAETNIHYLSRCQAKLGSLSPNGAPGAYLYVVESLPVFGSALPSGVTFTAPTSTNPWGVTQPITRASTILSIGTGIVNVYVANAAGAVAGAVQDAVANVTWSAGVATVTVSGPHGLGTGQTGYAIISGVKGATGVNNQVASTPAWQVTATGTLTFTFNLATNPGTYTSGGSAEVGDLGMADAAIQAQAVPTGMVALVQSAVNAGISVTTTVYLKASSGIGNATAQTNIANALTAYFASVPIGGVNAEASNIVPWSEILTTIANANPGTVSVLLTLPVGDVTIFNNQVPVLGTLTLTVVYV